MILKHAHIVIPIWCANGLCYSGPQLSGVSINERPIQGTDRFEATSFGLASTDDIITSIFVQYRRDRTGVESIVFLTDAGERIGPHSNAPTDPMREICFEAPLSYGLAGLYVTSSPDAIITEISPIWDQITLCKCEQGPAPRGPLDINEIRHPKASLAHQASQTHQTSQTLQTSRDSPHISTLNPDLVKSFTIVADEWIHRVSTKAHSKVFVNQGQRHKFRPEEDEGPITKVEFSYHLGRSPPLPSPKCLVASSFVRIKGPIMATCSLSTQ